MKRQLGIDIQPKLPVGTKYFVVKICDIDICISVLEPTIFFDYVHSIGCGVLFRAFKDHVLEEMTDSRHFWYLVSIAHPDHHTGSHTTNAWHRNRDEFHTIC